ncbi:MAG: Polysaccharide biosynthesis/export protein [Gemmataceae bacterium]|nr:Polysaccharide biosynthesis/export protein [Gemmataceae bacterium]
MGASRRAGFWLVFAVAGGGCTHFHQPPVAIPDVPNERQKSILSEYRIEPPDLLQIDLLYAVPLPPYKIQPLDVLAVTVANTLEGEPIAGLYPVEPDGVITLGGRYRTVKVVGLTPAEAKAAIQTHLDGILKDAKVTTVGVAEGRGVQLVRGQHLVRPDGTVSLGSYGSVVVVGHTLKEAKALIEAQLGNYLQSPEVILNVIGYNSKVYYLIFDFGGAGQQVVRQPVTGNDTVLDAISQINGLSAVSDPRGVWVARSAGPGEPDQILPVDWCALTTRGRAETNYQLVPGDRIFVKAYPMAVVDTKVARALAPFERIFGFTLLGTATYQQIRAAAKGLTSTGVAGGF